MAEMTLEEAFAAATVDVPAGMVDDVLVIDAPNRKIIVPDSETAFGVETDRNVERKYFRCPRIVGDNIDLYTHKIYVVYVFAKDSRGTFQPEIVNGTYWCDDVAVDGDCITFSWKLSDNVLTRSGIIAFKILAATTENGLEKTRWNTTPAYGTILMTVPDGDDIAERYPDIVTQLLERMDAVEAIATEEAMQGYVNEYLREHPVVAGATEEQAAQIDQNTQGISELKDELNNKFTGGELDKNGNLIFESDMVIGAYWYELDGTEIKNQYTASYCRTPKIEIESNTSYSAVCFVNGIPIAGAYSICFYDENGIFISSLRYTEIFLTPSNAKYISVSWADRNEMVGLGAFVLKKTTDSLTAYESPKYLPVHIVNSDYVTKEVTDNLDERITVLEGSSNKQYINLASDYYITNGDILELFYRGLLNLGDYKKYNIKIECSVGGYFEKRYIFTPTSSNVGNDYPLTLSLYDDNDKLIESATTTIHCIEKKRNPSNQVNVLCVGDSLTVGGQWVTEFRRLLTADGLSNVNFIGTCGESPSKYEGYGGWSIASYNSSMATNDYMWVNVSSHDKTSADQHSVYVDSNGTKWKIETIETNRLKMIRTSGSSAIPTSGSLTWERGGDNHSDIVYSSVEQASGNPFWNENINKNDFVTYANQQGVSTIDYCLILIGWNNSYWNESITKAETNRFINSLQTDFPNCKIILAGLQIPSLDGFGNNYGCDWYWKEKVNFVFNLQKWYEDIASSNDNVIFTQVSGQFDSENNMPKYQRTVNKRNSDKEYFGANGVHPADSGYLQFADVFYRAFESF